MKSPTSSTLLKLLPLVTSSALILTACGSGGSSVAQQAGGAAAPAAAAGASAPEAAPAAEEKAPAVATARGDASAAHDVPSTSRAVAAPASPGGPAKTNVTSVAEKRTVNGSGTASKAIKAPAASDPGKAMAFESATEQERNAKIAEQKDLATDVGVTRQIIKLGTVNMHGMALGNVLVSPVVGGLNAALASVNDRGGVLGRRLSLTDCDDGPGEVARAKACIKKLVAQDHIFSLLGGATWATASIHDDLAQYHLPHVGAWAYSQTEWQDPFMFPAHMSMIHEAMAGAHWVVNVIKPRTYGLICLTSPEMQLACDQVAKIVGATGARMVKRADVSISETSMSSYVLAMRAANPEHIVHYVINPATMAKFMVEASQQGYYPPKGISGNHLAAEVLGSIFGQWPTGRYWTNTTYKLWGPEFMATMNKYARANRGANHHIVQAGYVAANIFAQAARELGPNLTRDRLMAVLGNGTVWRSDASLDQRFSYIASERTGDNWNPEYGQGREFMYRYDSTNTVSNPDGTPHGWTPSGAGGPSYEGTGQFVLHTWK